MLYFRDLSVHIISWLDMLPVNGEGQMVCTSMALLDTVSSLAYDPYAQDDKNGHQC